MRCKLVIDWARQFMRQLTYLRLAYNLAPEFGTNLYFLAYGGMPELKMKAPNGFYSDDAIVEARIKERTAA